MEKTKERERKGKEKANRKERTGKGKGKDKERASARFAAHGHKKVRCIVTLGLPMSYRNFPHRLARELTDKSLRSETLTNVPMQFKTSRVDPYLQEILGSVERLGVSWV